MSEITIAKLRLDYSALKKQAGEVSKILASIHRMTKLDADSSIEDLVKAQKDISGISPQMERAKKALNGITELDFRRTRDEISEIKKVADKALKGLTEGNFGISNEEFNRMENKLNELKNVMDHVAPDTPKWNQMAYAIEKAEDAMGRLANEMRNAENIQQDKSLENIANKFTELSRRAIDSALDRMWEEAIQFAEQYGNAMNEVRIVTGKTKEEADMLGDSYLKLAQEMSVAATEVATAAVELYRQGLGDDEVLTRLGSAIEFAKVAAIETDQAVEIVTVALNTGQANSSEHASDVQVALGDAAATSAEEIATAMQRSASSAQNVGQTYEELATLITIVSARTRLSAETIGSSLQALFARMQNIRKTGYVVDEDGTVTVTNDIIKAFENINVTLGTNLSLLEADGVTWRSLWDVLNEVAAVYGEMSDAQRSYLLTAMAGVRQQDRMANILMGLSANTEGAMNAQNLLNIAMESGGVTAEKYTIYLDSVAAAQSNLKNSVDALVNAADGSDLMTKLYNGLAGVIDMVANGVDVFGSWAVIIPVVTGALIALAQAAKTAGSVKLLLSMFASSSAAPIQAITAAVAAIGGIGTQVSSHVTDAERFSEAITKMSEAQGDFAAQEDSAKSSLSVIRELGEKAQQSQAEQVKLNSALNSLASISPTVEQAVSNFNNKQITMAEVVDTATAALNNQAVALKNLSALEAKNALASFDTSSLTFMNSSDANIMLKFLSGEGNSEEIFSNGRKFDEKFIAKSNLIIDIIETLYGISDYRELSNEQKEDLKSYVSLAAKEYEETIVKLANNAVEQAIRGANLDIDSDVEQMFRDELMQALMQYDGNVSKEDQENAYNNMLPVINEYVKNFPAYTAEAFAQTLTERSGEGSNTYSGSNDVAEEMGATVASVIAGLIELGFSYADIDGLLDGLLDEDITDFDIRGILMRKVADMMGMTRDDFSEYYMIQNENGDYEDVNNEVLAAMKTLLEAGATAEDVDAIFAKSHSMAEFLGRLTEAAKEFKQTSIGDTLREMEAEGKVLEGLGDHMDAYSQGGKSAAKASVELTNDIIALRKAQVAYDIISGKTQKDTEEYNAAMEALGEYTGMSAEEISRDLPAVLEILSSDSIAAGNSVSYLMNMLLQTGAIDLSAGDWRNQQATQAASADNTTAAVANLVIKLLDVSGMNISMDNTGTIRTSRITGAGTFGGVTSKGATASAAKVGSSTGSGGGGGGSRTSATELMLDEMDASMAALDHARSIVQLKQSYYEARGEQTNYISAQQNEAALVEEKDKRDRKNLATIEEQIKAKQKEIDRSSEGSKAYKNAVSDLSSLVDAQQEYSKAVQENANDLDELNREMDKARRQIIELEVAVEEQVEQAIRDREELKRSMLEGEVEQQNTILKLIEQRYQKEWDAIKKSIELKREALEEEKDQIDKQLDARREAAEMEDKYAQLASYEAQLSRISADPTRMRDALEVQKKIDDLREEIGWDLAEDAAQKQKDTIDEEIEDLDKYGEYVDEWYTKLFENPVQLIEEMMDIIKMTDEEIIAWLSENDDTFKTTTEANQQQMVQGWQETINQMRGVTVTYWEEVNAILAQGQSAAIQFLQQNSAEYAAASEKQRKLQTADWADAFDAIQKAYIATDKWVKENPIVIPVVTNTSGGGLSYSEGSNAAGGASNKTLTQPRFPSHIMLKEFAEGGLVDFTGPAWVDGTKTNPEAFLNADDTRMIRAMLDAARMIKVGRGAYVDSGKINGSSGFNIESIEIHVDSLDTDQDMEELAEKLGRAFEKKLTQGMAVGGVQLG